MPLPRSHARMASFCLCLAFVLLALASITQAQDDTGQFEFGCYLPDHSPAFNHTPCNAQAQDSWCCHVDDICLDNGYCFQQSAWWSNRLGRGSCTDRTWGSPACPYYCGDVATDNTVSIYLAYDTHNGAFCCGENYDLDSKACPTGTRSSNSPFDLEQSNIVWNRTDGSVLENGTVARVSGVSQTTVTVTTTPSSEGQQHQSNVGSVAAGIAVPLAIVAIASLVASGILFKKNRQMRQELAQQREEYCRSPCNS
ncbi:hypothetical protein K431DRAFT_90742 [Polychaeton citri CBS 116435]|uniref:Uncharacterized protein n=1 Tax=Polychaeton citri CBS 116435 TaxID=1314669 RepID=A0A9P4UP46_9PEZI|nr:hypothetical protein K431DRAFT_90742 [Polychaeton citri CBS 116435]